MSFTRTPKPPVHNPDGLLFPVEIETHGPRTLTDSVLATLSGRRGLLTIVNVDPETRVSKAARVDMSSAELDHLIGRLTHLRDLLMGMGA